MNRGITTHGLAINVNNDLQPFEWIVPCGIEGVRMTSVTRELGCQLVSLGRHPVEAREQLTPGGVDRMAVTAFRSQVPASFHSCVAKTISR